LIEQNRAGEKYKNFGQFDDLKTSFVDAAGNVLITNVLTNIIINFIQPVT